MRLSFSWKTYVAHLAMYTRKDKQNVFHVVNLYIKGVRITDKIAQCFVFAAFSADSVCQVPLLSVAKLKYCHSNIINECLLIFLNVYHRQHTDVSLPFPAIQLTGAALFGLVWSRQGCCIICMWYTSMKTLNLAKTCDEYYKFSITRG